MTADCWDLVDSAWEEHLGAEPVISEDNRELVDDGDPMTPEDAQTLAEIEADMRWREDMDPLLYGPRS